MLPPVPDLPQRGYGLLADNITDEQTGACSVGVIEPQRQYGGWPVTITALRQQQGDDTNTITTSMPLLFSFPYKYNAKLCNNYSDWVVHRSLIGDDDSLETVMLGYSDHPISDSLFYIRPYDSSEKLYKLVSCHCSVCKHIGIHIDERSKTKRLVVTDGEPLVMRFVNRGRWL
ncbi:trypsin inhibitor B-like [Senna tora]|uniref:Trypsin inhibitor B-like n=1 Tax=Senna tora TaxID=362788 RepID=A0A834T2Z5_9FABA|nr:trypsin inhibitor B-like [Senna tora]